MSKVMPYLSVVALLAAYMSCHHQCTPQDTVHKWSPDWAEDHHDRSHQGNSSRQNIRYDLQSERTEIAYDGAIPIDMEVTMEG